MPNPLTGDYQAVVQISVRQINGLLGSLHQRRMTKGASPSFAHGGTVRYGVTPAIFAKDALRLGQWLTSAAGGAQSPLGPDGAERLPPGVRSFYETAVGEWDVARAAPMSAGAIRGVAEVQLSTPTISLNPGSTSEVTVEVRVRAHLHPDPGSAAMPEWIHGDVRAVYRTTAVMVSGQRKIRVQPPTQDNQVQFTPVGSSGLTSAETVTVTTEVRRALQRSFAPLDVDLPPGVAFDQFRALAGPGGSVALALPLQITGAPAGPGGLGTVNQNFIRFEDTGLAISREFVETITNPLLESLRAAIDNIPEVESFWGDYTFSGTISGSRGRQEGWISPERSRPRRAACSHRTGRSISSDRTYGGSRR